MSPRSKSEFEAMRRRSADTIKEVALELFAQHGFASTSISMIAQEAGVSRGLMYNYFDSKEALLHEIIMDAVAEGERIVEEAIGEAQSPHEQLARITSYSFDVVQADLKHWQLLTSLALQPGLLEEQVPELREKSREANAQLVGLFELMGSDAPFEEAHLYSAAMDGIMIQYIQLGPSYPLERMKSYLLDRFCRPGSPKIRV